MERELYSYQIHQDLNLALSKMEFATKIFEQKAPFDKFDFSSFLPLFKIVKEILNLPIQ